MQDELPLALVEEQAEGEVGAAERGEDGERDAFEEPDGADDFGGVGLLWCGAGHGCGVCIDFSIWRVLPDGPTARGEVTS